MNQCFGSWQDTHAYLPDSPTFPSASGHAFVIGPGRFSKNIR